MLCIGFFHSDNPMKTLILATKLLQNPLERRTHITRELAVRQDSSLYDLAEAIVNAYGFDFDHAFGFLSRTGDDFLRSERKYELFADMDIADEHPDSQSVRHTKVSDAWKKLGDTMTFLFDYGDAWRFTVQLIGIGVAEQGRKYPRIIKTEGNAPKRYPVWDVE